jgi:hypothetical protein
MSFFRFCITTSGRSARTADVAAARISAWASRSFRGGHYDRDAQGRDEERDNANFGHDKPSMGRRLTGQAVESAAASQVGVGAVHLWLNRNDRVLCRM